MRDYFGSGDPVRFIFPIDGDCLNGADGAREGSDLVVPVQVAARQDADLYVNGQRATFDGECFRAFVRFSAYRTLLYAEDRNTGEHAVVSVFKLHDPEKKFRLSSDDNIVFLRDLTAHRDEYRSIFDHPYLAMYRRVHEETGVCIDLNLFYEGFGNSIWGDERFCLTQVTDKFRDEWEANSGWLRLSFHAAAERPRYPYRTTPYEVIADDCAKVHREIIRFAGEKTLSHTMTAHYGAANEQSLLAVRNLGYRNVAGYFEFQPDGSTLVAYHYPKELVEHIGERDFWRDTLLDITFTRIDRVLNLAKTPEENLAKVREAVASPTRGRFIELMIHEQYFYKSYTNYIERFGDIVLEACRYLKEQDYSGAFSHDVTAPY